MTLFWLSDAQWSAIASLMPASGVGPKRLNDRVVISGIIHVLQSGCPWRNCPRDYGPYMTVFNRFNRWKARGIWQQIVDALAAGGHLSQQMLAHRAQLASDLRVRRRRRRNGIEPHPGFIPSVLRHAPPTSEDRRAAAAELEQLVRIHQGQPIDDWLDTILEWHLNAQAAHDTAQWIPGMAASDEPAVTQAVERFHQHSFKLTVDRLTAEIVDLRVKLLTAIACMNSYAEDPQNNVSAAKATLKMLLHELGNGAETQMESESRRQQK